MVGSGARGDGADLSVALWADLSVGSRRGDAGGAWPVSVADHEAGAADLAPPPSATSGGFSPFSLIFKAPPVRNGVDTLAFFTAVSAISFPFLFRARGRMDGSSAISSSSATRGWTDGPTAASARGASLGRGGWETKIGHVS